MKASVESCRSSIIVQWKDGGNEERRVEECPHRGHVLQSESLFCNLYFWNELDDQSGVGSTGGQQKTESTCKNFI